MPNRLLAMSTDAKKQAVVDIRRAQTEFERTGSQHEEAREARRESFQRAQGAGLTLREIADAVDLHWTRVGKIVGTQ